MEINLWLVSWADLSPQPITKVVIKLTLMSYRRKPPSSNHHICHIYLLFYFLVRLLSKILAKTIFGRKRKLFLIVRSPQIFRRLRISAWKFHRKSNELSNRDLLSFFHKFRTKITHISLLAVTLCNWYPSSSTNQNGLCWRTESRCCHGTAEVSISAL